MAVCPISMAPASESEPSASTSSPPTNQKTRKRASRPKVKTGCIVCKIRRVKCDETKPACNKCTSTGRKCDGYIKRDESITSREQQREALSTALVSARPNNRVPIPRNPQPGAIVNAHKDRLGDTFDFYRHVTLPALNRGTGEAPWNAMILQLSQSVPAVVYAGAACGAISRRMRLVDVARNTGTLDQVRGQALELQNTADNLYARALNGTREQLGRSDANATDAALVACFLLQTFEFLRGNAKGSLIHQVNGLAILHRQNENTDERSGNKAPPLRSQINAIFSQWDMRASGWMGLERSLKSMVASAKDANEIAALSNMQRRSLLGPDGFLSLDHAMKAQRQLITSHMSFGYSVNYWSARDEEESAYVEHNRRRQGLIKEADLWRNAFNVLVYRISSDLSEIDRKCVALLDISTRALRLRLLTTLQENEDEIYAAQTREFALIMALAEPLLFPSNIMRRMRAGEKGSSSAAEEIPLAYFNLGLIQPLYHVAIKCADTELRQRAIDWLEKEPWNEGGFNSAQAARIARKSVGLPDQMNNMKLEDEIQPPGYYHHAHMVPMIADKS